MNPSVYQDIWDADQATNGLPAVRPGEPRSDDQGFVAVDERTEPVAGDHRVLTEVVIPDSKRETYDLCGRLFNNYTLDPGVRELVTVEETQEEKDFIDAIVGLPPLQVAKAAIAQEQGQSISDLALAAMIKETWFLQGRAGSKHASGFEHVFVGEQSERGDKPDDQAAKMSGYHFWYKYHLDELGDLLPASEPQKDRIIYQAARYSGADDPAHGLLVPEIVTLRFQWTAHDFITGENQILSKSIGGFWVGCSPEGLIALGLVRTRTRSDKLAEINGSTYQLDLHRLDGVPTSIRTFFPRFLRCSFCDIVPGEGNGGEGNEPEPGTGTNDPTTSEQDLPAETVRIVAARVNPAGHDPGRETVTLINSAAAPVELSSWAVEGPNGTRFIFADVTLADGEVRTFRMPTSGAQFRNRGGDIRLLDGAGAVHHQVTYTRQQADPQGRTVVF